jgi:nucleoside-diphosphate-sugar epimerase
VTSRAILITGGDGYLGSLVARKILDRRESPVFLWVRAADAEGMARKRDAILRVLPPERISIFGGDLTDGDPFRDVPWGEVDTILHTAANIVFSVDEDTARKVNVEGTAKLIDAARRCPALETLGYVSSVYVSGLRTGTVPESQLDGDHGFANHYERSKWQAESLFFSEAKDLPWRIFRVATAVADDDTGAVTQRNAVHDTLRLFFYGLLPLLPGRPDTKPPFVTGDFVAEALVSLLGTGKRHEVYHLAHGPEESLSLGELVDLAFDLFGADPDFRERRILKPPFTDREGFELMVQGISPFPGVLSRSVAALAPFARQLYAPKSFENRNLRAALSAYRAPDARALARRVTESLVATRWGRNPA